MKWELRDRLRVLDTSEILGGCLLTNGKVYVVYDIFEGGYEGDCLIIESDNGVEFRIGEDEMPYVERVTDITGGERP